MMIVRTAMLLAISASGLFAQINNLWTVTGAIPADTMQIQAECTCTGFQIQHSGYILIQFNVASAGGVFDDSKWQYVANVYEPDQTKPTLDGWNFGQIPQHAKFRVIAGDQSSKVYGYSTTP